MRLRLRFLSILAVVRLLAALALSGPASAGGRPFSTTLSGANEVPGPGDPDGSGTAHLTLNSGSGEVCFQITVSNIALPATGAHIHEAPVGSAGPIVVVLVPPDESGSSSGCVSADSALIKDIR